MSASKPFQIVPAITFEIPNAFQCTGYRGTIPTPLQFPLLEICQKLGVKPVADSCVLRIRWDKNLSFLELKASFAEKANGEPQQFVSDLQGVRSVFTKSLPANLVGSEESWTREFSRFNAYAALIPLSSYLSLAWRVNTDSTIFMECDTILGDGIADLDEPRQVEVAKLVYARRIGDSNPPLNAIQLFPTIEIHWLDSGVAAGNSKVYRKVEKRILIEVSPGRELDTYPGYAAIDFGNTNSAFARIKQGEFQDSDIRFVQCDQSENSTRSNVDNVDLAIPSAVRLKKLAVPKSSAEIPDAEWVVGESALVDQGGDLLLGGKRLLADPRREQDPRDPSRGSAKYPKDLPAELFLTRLLRSFYANEFGLPEPIAITYPTTFSDAEIERTREAVYKAIRRSVFLPNYFPRKRPTDSREISGKSAYQEQLDRYVPRKHMLDEATAAAFYFLYKDFLRGPGRVPAAYFEYPNGINILLYDCGGGTTDIALIHCHIEPGQSSSVKVTSSATSSPPALNKTWRVKIDVLGRTGHRDFGGDSITIATFKVLKATLSQQISQFLGDDNGLDWASVRNDEVEEWLRRNYHRTSRLIPTNWIEEERDPKNPARIVSVSPVQRLSADDLALRKRVTLDFWHWSEKVKKNLAGVENASPEELERWANMDRSKHPLAPSSQLVSELETLIRRRNPSLAGQQIADAIQAVVEDFKVIRERVDSLIKPDIERTIRAANAMISERLHEATRTRYQTSKDNSSLPSDSVVHWLYVVGKASRYSAIRSALTHLDIPELVELRPDGTVKAPPKNREPRSAEGGRLRFEADVLKTCVAGGAALAFMSVKTQTDIKIEYDHDLSSRLPFSIGVDTAEGHILLFRENQRYDGLSPAWIPVAKDRVETDTTLWLKRQWPGQGSDATDSPSSNKWENFMRFDFRTAPTGPIKIEYGIDPSEPAVPGSIRKTFIMTDMGRNHQRVIGKEVAERQYVSPAQYGNL